MRFLLTLMQCLKLLKIAQICSKNALSRCCQTVICCQIVVKKSDFFVSEKSLVFIKKKTTCFCQVVRPYYRVLTTKKNPYESTSSFPGECEVSGGFKSRKRQESACVTPLLYIYQSYIVNIIRFKTLEERQPLSDLDTNRT